jgi:oxygen-dependent protoporphyrinogen oxidase
LRIVVIGGGISGLACAYRLRQLGVPVLLLEQASRVGGAICSVRQEGFLFELGPQSFLSNDLLLELMESLGLSAELQRADSRAPRYILQAGRLHALPLAPPALLTTSLLGLGSKLRLLSEPFRRTRPPEDDESVAAFVRRKFSADLLENFIAPFVSGVYAGDPEKLSLRSAFPSAYQWEKEYGSVLRGAMKSRPPKGRPRPALCSFPGGVETLVRTLGEKLGDALKRETTVVSIRRGRTNGQSAFTMEVTSSRGAAEIHADVIVMAAPTRPAGRLLASVSESVADQFNRIEYAPVAVVATGYRRDHVGHPLAGFGFLVPRKEGLRTLGTVWNSSLFPGRAPEGMVCLTSFAGGATDPELVKLPADEILGVVSREAASVLNITGAPEASLVQRYDAALPQYNLGHGKVIAALRELCAGVPGLFLAGNYLGGPSIGSCVEQAFAAAEAVHRHLAAPAASGATPRSYSKATPS